MRRKANIVRIDVDKELAKPYDEKVDGIYARILEVGAGDRLISAHECKERFGTWFVEAVKDKRLKALKGKKSNSPTYYRLSDIYAKIDSDIMRNTIGLRIPLPGVNL